MSSIFTIKDRNKRSSVGAVTNISPHHARCLSLSIGSTWPLIDLAASEARNTASAAMSAGLIIALIDCAAIASARTSSTVLPPIWARSAMTRSMRSLRQNRAGFRKRDMNPPKNKLWDSWPESRSCFAGDSGGRDERRARSRPCHCLCRQRGASARASVTARRKLKSITPASGLTPCRAHYLRMQVRAEARYLVNRHGRAATPRT